MLLKVIKKLNYKKYVILKVENAKGAIMSYKKIILIILIGVLVIGMGCVSLATEDKNTNKTQTEEKTNTSTESKDEADKSTNTSTNTSAELEKDDLKTNTADKQNTSTEKDKNTSAENTSKENTSKEDTKKDDLKNETNKNTATNTSTKSSESNSSVVIEYDKTDLTDKGIKTLSLMSINESGEMEEITLTPEFDTNTYEYECEVSGTVKSIDYSVITTDKGMSYEVFGEESLIHGENTITILVSNSKKTEYTTYQITVNKTLDGLELNDYLDESAQKIRKQKILILVWVSVIVIGIIIILIGRNRVKKMNRQNNRRKRS